MPDTDVESRIAGPRVLAAGVELAGLLHDLGKCSPEFQDKLRKKARTGDPIRHEAISVLILRRLVERLASKGCKGDEAFLRALERERDIPDALEAILSDKTFAPTLDERDDPLPPKREGRLFRTVCGLVLSHHKLIGSTLVRENGLPALDPTRSVNVPPVSGQFVSKRLGASWKKFGCRQDREEWCRRVADAATRLREALPPSGLPDDYWRAFAWHGRHALMLGDHHASARYAYGDTTPEERVRHYLANNERLVEKDADGQVIRRDIPGQTLAQHLLRVGTAAAIATRGVRRLAQACPDLENEDVPDAIRNPARHGRFAWQGKTADMVRRHRAGREREGFLAFVTASTGSGKTRVIPSILSAANGRLRYTVGMGLRTLTLQTGREYRSRIGIEETLVAIGDPTGVLLDRLAANRGEPGIGPGTESPDQSPIAVTEGEAPVLDLPGFALRWCDGPKEDARKAALARNRAFLAAPVVCCTLDMVMAAVGHRASNLVQAARVASADLVIDEIDDFTPEDVAAILRLVELSSSHGRSVVVSSATLPPPVVEAIAEAYAAGRRMKAAMEGASPGYDVAWISDAEGASSIDTVRDASRAAGAHSMAVEATAARLEATHSGRRMMMEDAEPSSVEEMFRAIDDRVRDLHRTHHAVCPRTGKRVSVGLVRFSNVRPSLEFARHLYNAPHREEDVVICVYNGSMLPIARHMTETRLAGVLSRGGDVDPLFVDGSPMRPFIDASFRKDVILVVVSTSVEDTGRDHDYDWQVVEPSTVRRIVQVAGRLRRHRPPLGPEAPPNLYVMPRLVRDLEGSGGQSPLSFPGIDTGPLGALGCGLPPLEDHSSAALLAGEGFDARIDARPLLGTPASPLGRRERELWRRMISDAPDGASMAAWRAYVDHVYADAFPGLRRFRRKESELVYLLRNGRYHSVAEDGSFAATDHTIPFDRGAPTARMLFDMDLAAAEAEVGRLAEEAGAAGSESFRRAMLTVTVAGRAKLGTRLVRDPAWGHYLIRLK